MKIKYLLWLLVAIFSLSITTTYFISSGVESDLTKELEYYTKKYNPGVVEVINLRTELLNLNSYSQRIDETNYPQIVTSIYDSIDRLNKAKISHKGYHSSHHTTEEFEYLDTVIENSIKAVDNIIEIYETKNGYQNLSSYRKEIAEYLISFEVELTKYVNSEFIKMENNAQKMKDLSNSFFFLVIIVIAIGLIVSITIVFLINRSISHQAKELVSYIDAKKNNKTFNLSDSFIESKSELGVIARSFIQLNDDLETTDSLNNKLSQLNESLEQSKAELKEREKKFESLYNNAPLSYQSLDEDGRFIDVNDVWLRTLGYSRVEVIGKEFGDFLHPDWQSHFKTNFPAFKRRGYVSDVQFKIRCKNGEYKYIAFEGCIGYYPDGKFKQTYCVFQDITDRIDAQIELHKLSQVVKQSPAIIAITDLKGNIEFVNQKFSEVTEYSSDEVLDKNFRILSFENRNKDSLVEMWKTINSNKLWRGEFQNRKKNGELYWESAVISPIYDNNGKVINYMKIAEDITQQKRFEENLHKNEKLKSIGVLAGGIAHDFNNILTGVFGNISLVKELVDEGSEEYNILNDSEKSIGRASKLTRQLLTFSKGGTPVISDLNIDEFIAEHVDFDLTGSNVKPIFSMEEDIWPIKADKGQISQVISSIVINATQAMPDGGKLMVNLSNCSLKENEVGQLQEGDYIKVSFEDNGVGISSDNIGRVFDPYFTTKEKGSGLGLSIVYSIMESHKGGVQVESIVGEKTIFTIYLPAEKEEVEVVKDGRVEVELDEDRPHRILLMDDEEVICNLVSKMLEKFGYDISTVYNGQELIDEYKRSIEIGKPFDLLIMDLTIPGGMGGKDAISHILDINPDAKAIVSSGYSDNPVISNYKDYGFIGILEKPYLIKRMRETIEKYLSKQ